MGRGRGRAGHFTHRVDLNLSWHGELACHVSECGIFFITFLSSLVELLAATIKMIFYELLSVIMVKM